MTVSLNAACTYKDGVLAMPVSVQEPQHVQYSRVQAYKKATHRQQVRAARLRVLLQPKPRRLREQQLDARPEVGRDALVQPLWIVGCCCGRRVNNREYFGSHSRYLRLYMLFTLDRRLRSLGPSAFSRSSRMLGRDDHLRMNSRNYSSLQGTHRRDPHKIKIYEYVPEHPHVLDAASHLPHFRPPELFTHLEDKQQGSKCTLGAHSGVPRVIFVPLPQPIASRNQRSSTRVDPVLRRSSSRVSSSGSSNMSISTSTSTSEERSVASSAARTAGLSARRIASSARGVL